MFSFARPGRDLAAPGVRALIRASEPRIFSVPKSLHDSVDGHPNDVRSAGGFRPVPDHAKERGRLGSVFLHFDANAVEIRFV